MARPWHPSPAIRLTYLAHAAAAAGLVATPGYWPQWIGLLAVNHVALTAAGLWPRSSLLGPNLTCLPPMAAARGEVALTIDDGPDPKVTPRVLDILDAAGIKATFFCIGERAVRHPALVRSIVARGHAVENHSQHHGKLFAALGPRRMRGEVADAQATLADITGVLPAFFRAPAGLRSPFLEPILASLDLRLATWTRRAFDTRYGDGERVLKVLCRNLSAGDILLLHDGNAARNRTGEAAILAVLPGLLAAFHGAGLRPVTLSAAMAPREGSIREGAGRTAG